MIDSFLRPPATRHTAQSKQQLKKVATLLCTEQCLINIEMQCNPAKSLISFIWMFPVQIT